MFSNEGPGGDPQIVYYDPGIGTEGSFLQRIRSGAFGEGIDLNIRQLYTFLAMNYNEGDDIYLFGFSRGAYTVRSLAGMMHESGLVYRHKLGEVKEAYDLYRNNVDVDSDIAKKFREENSRRVPIKLLACFDTVGSLGLPVDAIPFGHFLLDAKKYAFHDTTIGENIANAIHVMSIDEDRKGFLATNMVAHPSRGPDQVTEVFMPGHHSGVGGGSIRERHFSDNALRFLIEEIDRRGIEIGFNRDMVPEEKDVNSVPIKLSFSYKLLRFAAGEQCRQISSIDALHESTFKRYNKVEAWRPEALKEYESNESFLSKLALFKDVL